MIPESLTHCDANPYQPPASEADPQLVPEPRPAWSVHRLLLDILRTVGTIAGVTVGWIFIASGRVSPLSVYTWIGAFFILMALFLGVRRPYRG